MSELTLQILAFAASAIVVGLAVYASSLRTEVKLREQARQQALREVEQQAWLKTMENVHLICRALLNGQVDVMEASLRIRTLVDIIAPQWFEQQEEMKVFAEITRRGAHLATHQARKELPKQERMKQDLERIALEGEYHDAALEGARWLLQQKP